jgi:hypothetical protein
MSSQFAINHPISSSLTNISITMSIVQQIQDNTITNLRVSGEDDDAVKNIHQVIEALEKNNTILSATFHDDFLGCLRNDVRSKLMNSLGRISSLQEAHLEDALLMVSDVADLLVQAEGLKVLTLKNIVLQGVKEQFDACEMALYQHGSVKEFRMDKCTPALEEISLERMELAGKKQGVCPTTIQTAQQQSKGARTA